LVDAFSAPPIPCGINWQGGSIIHPLVGGNKDGHGATDGAGARGVASDGAGARGVANDGAGALGARGCAAGVN
jgi:hypothetical protein